MAKIREDLNGYVWISGVAYAPGAEIPDTGTVDADLLVPVAVTDADGDASGDAGEEQNSAPEDDAQVDAEEPAKAAPRRRSPKAP